MVEKAVEERGEERMRFRISWLIVSDASDPWEILTLPAEDGEKTLPIFSFEEEALLFLRLSGLSSGWRVCRSGLADLLSMLSNPSPNAGRVALDPIPEFGLYGSHDLLSLTREEFVGLLAAES